MFNEQGNQEGYNQWYAKDPTLGDIDIIEDGGQKYAVYGRQYGGNRGYYMQRLNPDGTPRGEPQWVDRPGELESFLKAAAPVAAVAAMPFAVSGLQGLFGGAASAAGAGAEVAGADVLGSWGSWGFDPAALTAKDIGTALKFANGDIPGAVMGASGYLENLLGLPDWTSDALGLGLNLLDGGGGTGQNPATVAQMPQQTTQSVDLISSVNPADLDYLTPTEDKTQEDSDEEKMRKLLEIIGVA
jgi:hypothetical protein